MLRSQGSTAVNPRLTHSAANSSSDMPNLSQGAKLATPTQTRGSWFIILLSDFIPHPTGQGKMPDGQDSTQSRRGRPKFSICAFSETEKFRGALPLECTGAGE